MQEENKQLKGELKALQESIKFQNETYKNMKKDMTEEKQKLKTDNRKNDKIKKLVHQNTKTKEQIAELEKRHTRNNLRFMGINEKSGVKSKTFEENEAKVKVFCKKN